LGLWIGNLKERDYFTRLHSHCEALQRVVTIQVPTLALVNEPQEDGQPLLVRGWLF
jgi:hypothetical protein